MSKCLLILLLLMTITAPAQVPQIINYQSRVAVGGANFDGSGQFKFALVNANGSTTYWSNDGTSTAGSQPTAAVTLAVSKGLYSVQLGDIALTNMTAIPASVFTNADVRLRVWFNDGVNGSQLLSPDHRIAAVGYAMMAGGVNLPATADSSAGVINQDGVSLLHTFGTQNVFVGQNAGNFTMTGSYNSAAGWGALYHNTTGSSNAALGYTALNENASGDFNTAVGTDALAYNITGSSNTACGYNALGNNTVSGSNSAFGYNALRNHTGGTGAHCNTAIGAEALASDTDGVSNTAVGWAALFSNTIGIRNTGIGYQAIQSNMTGNENTAVGEWSLLSNTGGNNNTALGFNSLAATTGSNNIALGNAAGNLLTAGSNNIAIGNSGAAAESNTIRIGTVGTQTKAFIAGISGVTSSGGAAVFVNGSGQLGTVTSSRRFKDNIETMDKASESLLSLRPVTFRYKPEIDAKGIPQFGLIAEEVDKVNPDLVVRDEEGVIQTVRYEQVNAMLLNEFLKEHARVKEMEARLAELEAKDKEREARLAKLEQSMQLTPQVVSKSDEPATR